VESFDQGSPVATHDDRDPGRLHTGHRGACDPRRRWWAEHAGQPRDRRLGV